MNHYVDIQIRPDPEFPAPMLMGALVSKLHRALVELDADDIGISLPEHETDPPLGHRLRLHASRVRLEELLARSWLHGMRDHIVMHDVAAVPANAEHRVVRRRQYKTNADRLRRRRMKRHNETYEQARLHIPDSVERRVRTPYVRVRSHSTGQAFCLFVEHGDHESEPRSGRFSTYGLSATATVPWF